MFQLMSMSHGRVFFSINPFITGFPSIPYLISALKAWQNNGCSIIIGIGSSSCCSDSPVQNIYIWVFGLDSTHSDCSAPQLLSCTVVALIKASGAKIVVTCRCSFTEDPRVCCGRTDFTCTVTKGSIEGVFHNIYDQVRNENDIR